MVTLIGICDVGGGVGRCNGDTTFAVSVGNVIGLAAGVFSVVALSI